MNRIRAVVAGVGMALVLAAAGCGGEDEGDGAEPASDSSTCAIYDITAEEFILATNKQEILDEYVANEPNNCSKVDDDFVLTASAAATNVPADAPLDEVIVEACGEPGSS